VAVYPHRLNHAMVSCAVQAKALQLPEQALQMRANGSNQVCRRSWLHNASNANESDSTSDCYIREMACKLRDALPKDVLLLCMCIVGTQAHGRTRVTHGPA
jgi:hypothetical protein